eukprot:scaffold3073_cov93-Isochrysis_galbana.AAC.1
MPSPSLPPLLLAAVPPCCCARTGPHTKSATTTDAASRPTVGKRRHPRGGKKEGSREVDPGSHPLSSKRKAPLFFARSLQMTVCLSWRRVAVFWRGRSAACCRGRRCHGVRRPCALCPCL